MTSLSCSPSGGILSNRRTGCLYYVWKGVKAVLPWIHCCVFNNFPLRYVTSFLLNDKMEEVIQEEPCHIVTQKYIQQHVVIQGTGFCFVDQPFPLYTPTILWIDKFPPGWQTGKVLQRNLVKSKLRMFILCTVSNSINIYHQLLITFNLNH